MAPAEREIRLCEDAAALAQQTAAEFLRLAGESVAARGRFTVALAGGSTPRAAYALLSSEAHRAQVPWQQIHFFWGDERHVPPDHADSNYHMAHEAMLAHVPVPANQIYRIASEKNAQQAADEYSATLKTFFALSAGELPCFDLVLLGMGPDGHTASLFPGTTALHERRQLVVAPWVTKFSTFRITMTVPVLCNAANVIFAAGGADKTATLKQVLRGEYRPSLYPSQMIKPTAGRLLWLVDKTAASQL